MSSEQPKSSWRQIASEEAQRDLDGLLDTVLRFAQKELAARGEFYPFAATIGNAGTSEFIALGEFSGESRPDTSRVLNANLEALVARREEIRAAAVASNVRLGKPLRGDAIQVDLEHAEGHALSILLPYMRKRQNRFEYSALRGQPGHHLIWPAPRT
jgi:hypothetical protein